MIIERIYSAIGATAIVGAAALFAAGAAGWVMNIVSLVSASTVTGLELFRVVGIVIPIIGAVLGWV